MDTTKLKVGDVVRMTSGCYGGEGKVVEVTSEGVTVAGPPFGRHAPYFDFDKDGKEPGPDMDECRLTKGFYADGGGPWELVEDENVAQEFERLLTLARAEITSVRAVMEYNMAQARPHIGSLLEEVAYHFRIRSARELELEDAATVLQIQENYEKVVKILNRQGKT